MAQKEIEAVKDAEKKALSIVSNAKERAETIKKSAKATGETTKRQELTKFKKEMDIKREQAGGEIVKEADAFRAQGKSEAEDYRREGSTRLNDAVARIVSGVVGK